MYEGVKEPHGENEGPVLLLGTVLGERWIKKKKVG